MDTSTETVGDVLILAINTDHLDASNSNEFRQVIAPLTSTHKKLVLDLAHLKFVDSSGLGAILSCLRRLNSEGGDLKLCGMTRQVRVFFELVRMHRIVEVLSDRSEAAQAFARK